MHAYKDRSRSRKREASHSKIASRPVLVVFPKLIIDDRTRIKNTEGRDAGPLESEKAEEGTGGDLPPSEKLINPALKQTNSTHSRIG